LIGLAGAVTPVPGGTGPITTLMLARNTVEAGHAQMAGNLDSLKGPLEGFSQFSVE